MRQTPRLGMLLIGAACLTLAITAQALPSIGEKHNGFSIQDERALHVYVDCWHAFKARCGRNIVDDGLSNGDQPTDAQVGDWLDTMQRWLHPPAPAASTSSDVVAPAPATTSVAPSSAGGCPASMAPESGQSYTAVNPSSGAYGCYQILPSTAAAHGCDLSTPGGQDECAARICATEGNGAWAASGAAPCG